MAIFVGAVVSRSELINNTLVMAKICVWDYIIFIGIYAATLSSAIASLVGAPRILMAIANDNIIAIPGISYFAKTDSKGEPVRGYFLSFIIAFAFNLIAPYVVWISVYHNTKNDFLQLENLLDHHVISIQKLIKLGLWSINMIS